ncbi:cytochrome P450 [Myxococcota bacterium]|nr:cytochrome P450 [Myxococcota bacterium]
MAVPLDTVDFAFDEMPGDDLHEVLRAYREQGPVAPTRFLGIPAFVITGHAALLDAFRDVERFPPHRMYEVSFEGAIGKSFISMEDLAEHRVYRKLATPAFRSRAVQSYERSGLAALAHEMIDALGDREEIDLVAEFTARFPYLVITRLLGLPREREEEFHRWALALLRFREEPAEAESASRELTEFLAPVVAARRRQPCNDVISELVAATVEGRRLEDEEIYSHVRLLFPTGGETTHGSLGNLLFALLSREGAWSDLKRNPSLIEAAVDEVLRWETPIAVLPRLSSSQPVEFHGTEIPPDSWVLFAIAAANRDPEVFEDPDRFDIHRKAPEMLTFGRGVKSCPGMHLVRRNMAVALETLFERMPNVELLDVDASLPRRTVLRSPDALRVRRTGGPSDC